MNFISQHFYIVNTSPFFPLTLGLVVGIICQSFLITSLLLPLLSIAIIAILSMQAPLYRKYYSLILFLFAYSIGSFLYQNQLNQYEQFYSQIKNNSVDIIGTVIDIAANSHATMKTTLILRVTHIKITNSKQWKSTSKSILIYTNNCDKLCIGDNIMLTNIQFKKPKNKDFALYLIKQKIIATLFINQVAYTLRHRPSFSFNRWIFNQRKQLFDNIRKKMSSKTFILFSSLFLGNRATFKEKIQSLTEQFKKWGISHLLARSGIHLTIFIFTWKTILYLLPFSFILKQYILTILSMIYFFFSWPSISFARAFSIYLLYQLCNIAKKPIHFLHLFFLTCFLFLILNPMQLFFLDFQLSFSLTFVLAWFNQLYQRKHS